jgi:hypothetical protein
MHACSYGLLDKSRLTYNFIFNDFVLPISEGFGPHDDQELLGMFRRSELQLLQKEELITSSVPGRTQTDEASSWAVGDRAFALNLQYLDATRLRSTPEKASNFNGMHVVNDAKVIVLELSGEFARIQF